MIVHQSGAKAHLADTFDWRKWAYTKALDRDCVDDAIVIVQPWIRSSANARAVDAYQTVAALIVEGLAAGGAVRSDRRISALIVRAPLPCGKDGVRVEVLPARQLTRLLGEPVFRAQRRSVKNLSTSPIGA